MTTEEVVRKVIGAYDSGDADAASALLHKDMHYCIHSDEEFGPYCANCHGIAAFWEAVGHIQADWNIDSYKLADLIVSGDRAAAQIKIQATSRHTGTSFQTGLALFFTVKDGLVSELHEYHDTVVVGRSRE